MSEVPTPARPQRILCTGASRGIGRAVARHLALEGRSVVALARDAAALGALAAEVAAVRGAGRLEPLVCDLDEPDALAGAVARAEALVGTLDGLVPAAAIADHRALPAIDAGAIDAHFRTNVRAPLLLARDFAECAGAGASIVFVSSTLAGRPALHTTMYAATKGALVSATKALALELVPRGIRVNAIVPGLVETEMIRRLRLSPGEAMPGEAERRAREDAQLAALARLVPSGRLARPEEIAPAVAWLLDQPLAVGTVLVLDGGLTL